MKTAIYARVSTEDQEREGTSLESQKEACLKKACELGYEVPEEFIFIETYSGLTLDRPELTRLRTRAKEGTMNAVIFYTLDRLSRDPVHLIILQDEFEKAKMAIIPVTESIDSSDLGKLITHIKGYAAKIEAEKVRERTMRGKQEILRRGLLPQGTGKGLYGYEWNKETKKRVPHPFEVEVVRKVFELIAQGNNPYLVAKKLNGEGIPTKTGAKWHPLTIKRMVTNPAYVGLTYFAKTRRVSGQGSNKRQLELRRRNEWMLLPESTPPIMSQELFDKAQEALKRPKLRPGRPLHDYLLTGHIACGDCGSPMIGTCLNRRYLYYRCRGAYPTASRPQICHAPYIKAETLENLVWGKMREVLEKPEIVLEEVKRRREENDFTSLEKEIARKHQQLDNNIKAEHRLIALLRHGQVDTDYVLDQIRDLKKEREEAEKRLAKLIELKDEQQRLENAEIKLDELCSRVRDNLDRCTFDEKRLALDALGIKVQPTSTQITIEGEIPLKFSSTEQTSA